MTDEPCFQGLPWSSHHASTIREHKVPGPDIRTYKAASNLDLVWDGVADNGIVEPDGVYKPVVKLARSHRVITLPSPIRIDTKPPVITVHHPLYPILSPDGDGRHDSFTFPTP